MTHMIPPYGSSKLMALCEYEDQFVPTLTPCSTDSLRLKNIRLPRMLRGVELPRELRTTKGIVLSSLNKNRFLMKAKIATKMALG